MALDAMIFDVDGTLVDNNDAQIEAWRIAFEQKGFSILPDRIGSEIGKGGDQLVESILGESANQQHGDDLRAAHTSEYIRIAQSTNFAVYPQAQELLDRLRRIGLKIAIINSSTNQELEATGKSANLNFSEIADVVVTGSTPDLIMTAVDKLGLSPAQCAMVGDTVHDASMCKTSGVVLLGIRTGPPTASAGTRLLAAGARTTYRDVADLLAHLNEALDLASPGRGHLTVDFQERLMREALNVAAEGLKKGEAPIGCVLAKGDGTIIARAHTEIQSTKNILAYAETVAFARAAGQIPLEVHDLLMVCTREPGILGMGAAIDAEVETVIFALRAFADGGTDRVRPAKTPGLQMPRVVNLKGNFANESRALMDEWLAKYPKQADSPLGKQYLALA